MKTAQRSILVLVPLSALGLYAACADSPVAPSSMGQGVSATRAGVTDAASFDSAGARPTAADPLLLTAATAQDASCTVELVKTWVFDPDKGKEGDWIAYDGGVVEAVPPENLYFKYDLKVKIPAKHYVNFLIQRTVLQPSTPTVFSRAGFKWKPKSLDGELAGNKSVQLEFNLLKTVTIGNDENVPVLGNTFEITAGWVCRTGLADEVNSGSLGTFKFKGVEKKKKK